MRKMILSLIGVSALVSFECVALKSSDAKSQGFACETSSGYLRYQNGGPDVRQAIDEINAARKVAYQQQATGGLSVSQIASAAGQKLTQEENGKYKCK